MRRAFSTVAIALVMIGLVGCPKNPANLSKPEVETLLKDQLTLKSVTIEAKPEGGGFTGTGQGSDGTEYKLDVKQDSKESKLTYTAESKNGEEIKSGFIKHN
jgi:hypothetical protein